MDEADYYHLEQKIRQLQGELDDHERQIRWLKERVLLLERER
jgi:uncharacterized protein YeeX (DUF496 family)